MTRGRRLLGRGKRRARVAGERALLRFVHGFDYFLGSAPDHTEPEPYDVVFHDDKLLLRSYPPPEPEEVGLGLQTLEGAGSTSGRPVLFIPPLMIRPLVYDLREGHSFIGLLRSHGFHPYIVDFGNPDPEDSTVGLDTYVLDWLPRTIDRMIEDCGRDDFVMVGYCMGGLFALMTAAAHPGERTPSAMVTIGSPIDSAKMGLLSFLARKAHTQIDAIASHVGNVPGSLSSNTFRLMTPLRSVTQKADLFLNLWDEEWLQGHGAIQAWIDGFLDYPETAFRDFVRDFMRDNRLLDGTMRFGDRTADLSNIQCPVLAFAGSNDKIVPVKAARAALGALGSEDVRFRVVPGGHMGVIAGRRAPRTVWEPTLQFLKGLPD